MLKAFLNFVGPHKIIAKSDNVLLAVSGGIDSVVLADLFHRAGFTFAIAHCNFQLRGNESDGDEEFVKKLAEKLGVSVHVKRFDTGNVASEHGISTQMAARDLRYNWFQELLQTENYDLLATAHQKNDNLETVIFNLTKGTGIAGFHGIKVKNNNIIRPLLFASREEIEKYAKEHRLLWREDRSNVSNKYHRNYIRNKVVPLLKEINPNLENAMEQTIRRISLVENYFLAQIDYLKPQLLEEKGSDTWLSLEKLNKIPANEALLAEILKAYGFNFSQTEDVLSAIAHQPGKIFFSEDYILNIDRTHIIISRKREDRDTEIRIGEKDDCVHTAHFALNIETLPVESYSLIRSKDIACLDCGKLEFPLTLRRWKPGDKFHPFGMGGQKKLSDFMIDEKIPVNLKSKVFVLISAGKIAWVVGHRIDDRFKIESKTKYVLKISKKDIPC